MHPNRISCFERDSQGSSCPTSGSVEIHPKKIKHYVWEHCPNFLNSSSLRPWLLPNLTLPWYASCCSFGPYCWSQGRSANTFVPHSTKIWSKTILLKCWKISLSLLIPPNWFRNLSWTDLLHLCNCWETFHSTVLMFTYIVCLSSLVGCFFLFVMTNGKFLVTSISCVQVEAFAVETRGTTAYRDILKFIH